MFSALTLAPRCLPAGIRARAAKRVQRPASAFRLADMIVPLDWSVDPSSTALVPEPAPAPRPPLSGPRAALKVCGCSECSVCRLGVLRSV